MYTKTGNSAYTAVSLDSQITGATPHQLIVLLYDGAINAMKRAEIYFQSGNIARRGEMISRAINIIDNGLRAGLDHEGRENRRRAGESVRVYFAHAAGGESQQIRREAAASSP